MRIALLLIALTLAACQTAPPATRTLGPVTEPTGTFREQLHWLPVGDRLILAQLCRPEREGAAPLVVVNHGSPPIASLRPAMQPAACAAEPIAWFLSRGHAVLLPLRRGYGASGGAWAEGYGPCDSADFARAGRETARDIAAAIAYARTLPDIQADAVIVVGQSAGGWGALALAEANPAGIRAIVNMAGGRGGRQGNAPNSNCRPDRLADAAAEFGRTARVPTLWIYTENDSFFSPAIAADMHRAYTGAGGIARLEALGPFGRDGHALFGGAGGSAVWGPIVEPWLAGSGS